MNKLLLNCSKLALVLAALGGVAYGAAHDNPTAFKEDAHGSQGNIKQADIKIHGYNSEIAQTIHNMEDGQELYDVYVGHKINPDISLALNTHLNIGHYGKGKMLGFGNDFVSKRFNNRSIDQDSDLKALRSPERSFGGIPPRFEIADENIPKALEIMERKGYLPPALVNFLFYVYDHGPIHNQGELEASITLHGKK